MYEAIIELPDFTYRFVTSEMFYEGDEVNFTVYQDGKELGSYKRKARYNRQWGVYFAFRGLAISNYEFN